MNKDNNHIIDDAVNFQLQRIFASLSRNILIIIEDLKQNHTNNFDKLRSNLPPELQDIIDMADYFDQNSYQYYRKKILDCVMSSKRDLENIL